MEFRLLYEGPLRSEGGSARGPTGRAKDKHELRKHFHPQLRELWITNMELCSQAHAYFFREDKEGGGYLYHRMGDNPHTGSNVKKYIEFIADDHKRCGGRFVPLVSEIGGFTCELNILFLRRDNPGTLVQSGGDIDNRIKVLLDGLRMPANSMEMGGYSIDESEDPFYCLLEDDKLITKVSVTTDRLLIPQISREKLHDVFLEIHVTVVNPNMIFAGNRLI